MRSWVLFRHGSVHFNYNQPGDAFSMTSFDDVIFFLVGSSMWSKHLQRYRDFHLFRWNVGGRNRVWICRWSVCCLVTCYSTTDDVISIGRRHTMLICAVGGLVSGVVTSLSPWFPFFVAFRFITAAFSHGGFLIMFVYGNHDNHRL